MLLSLFSAFTITYTFRSLFLKVISPSFFYFSFFFWTGIPASTPSVHALLAETWARLLLVSYYGFDQVTGSGVIGTWNWVQVITGFVFGVAKLAQNLWILSNRREYMAYENELKEKFH